MRLARVLRTALALTVLTTPGATAQVGRSVDVINPNLAGEQDLLAVPHLDAALVKAIMEQRPLTGILALNGLLSPSRTPEQLAETYRRLWIPINLNAATREEILLIPGVGNRMLREFMEYRPYRSLAVFHREIGKYVDDAELARLEQYVYVPIDLNTASDEDITSIPGVGGRMLREFKEYRPYRNIEQFRREIGKYVDEREVARLERYVTLTPAP
jgi:DNA uptake protein ComE-like DNA-binding protein